jgi:hypothetical protein
VNLTASPLLALRRRSYRSLPVRLISYLFEFTRPGSAPKGRWSLRCSHVGRAHAQGVAIVKPCRGLVHPLSKTSHPLEMVQRMHNLSALVQLIHRRKGLHACLFRDRFVCRRALLPNK